MFGLDPWRAGAAYTSDVTGADTPEPLVVSFVRAARVVGSGTPLQEWRSERTGRLFEVEERDAYRPAEELQRGARGFLWFVGGAPVVTREPAEPPPRPDVGPSRAPAPVQRPPLGGMAWLWGVLLVLALLALVGVLRP